METHEIVRELRKLADSGVPFERYKLLNAAALRLEFLQTQVDAMSKGGNKE